VKATKHAGYVFNSIRASWHHQGMVAESSIVPVKWYTPKASHHHHARLDDCANSVPDSAPALNFDFPM
jgi:hypothetical protein